MLKLNQIYKVKEGHEGKCSYFVQSEGSFIKITKIIDDNFTFVILDENKKQMGDYTHFNYFTEDDLEEEVKEEYNICPKCETMSVENKCPVCPKEKSLEDLEVGDELLENYYNVYKILKVSKAYQILGDKEKVSQWRSIEELKNQGYSYCPPKVKSLSPSEAETLLEAHLGYKVKIK